MNRIKRATEELQETMQACRDAYIRKARIEATIFANKKKREKDEALIIRYNSEPDFDALPNLAQREIALAWVSFKMAESGDAAWFIDPLPYDCFVRLNDSLIRGDNTIDEEISSQFLSSYFGGIADYYETFTENL